MLLLDKSLVGRGGATIMAQMTVAAAIGHEEPDHWTDHLQDTLAAGRELCDERLARLLCENGPARIFEMDGWGAHWARGENDRIRQVKAPGTRAGALLLRGLPEHGSGSGGHVKAPGKHAGLGAPRKQRRGDRDRGARRPCRGGGGNGRGIRRCGHLRRQGGHPGRGRPDQDLPPEQRIHQHGRGSLRPGAVGRGRAHRHGVRPVLSHRPSGPAPGGHGPDHVGPVPVQAGGAVC